MRPWSLCLLAAAARAWPAEVPALDRACDMTVVVSEETRYVHVSTPNGSYSSARVSSHNDRFRERIAATPLLCRVGPEVSGRVALVSLATTLEYLVGKQKKKHGHRMDILGALAAKDAYARQHGLPYYVWLGEMDRAGLQNRGACTGDVTNSTGHVYKALAMLALFDDRDLEWVVFVDMDTLPSRKDLAPDAYIRLAPDADVIGGSNPSLPILLNSGLMFLRSTPWTAALLESWWRLRCGFKDQLSLWRALFEAWAAESAEFTYDDRVFENYATARHAALPHVVGDAALNALAEPFHSTRWTCSGDCRRALQDTGCLLEPLRLRHVLLLPVVPFQDPSLPAFAGDVVAPSISRDGAGVWGDDYWFCHAACVFDNPKKPARVDDMGTCRNASTFHVYGCQCGDVYYGGRTGGG